MNFLYFTGTIVAWILAATVLILATQSIQLTGMVVLAIFFLGAYSTTVKEKDYYPHFILALCLLWGALHG